MKNLLLASAFIISLSPAAFAKENKSASAEAINTACTEDAATASCGNEKVGTGLLKCLHAYKKSHHDFKFSESCKTAMKDHRAEKMHK